MTGFSVGGRVVDSNGIGLEGVKIEIGNVERATTDSHGHYKLDQACVCHSTHLAICFNALCSSSL